MNFDRSHVMKGAVRPLASPDTVFVQTAGDYLITWMVSPDSVGPTGFALTVNGTIATGSDATDTPRAGGQVS